VTVTSHFFEKSAAVGGKYEIKIRNVNMLMASQKYYVSLKGVTKYKEELMCLCY
jgi:hypothetical protein